MNLPNIITLTRLCCVPVVVWLILSDMISAAFWVCLGAAASDALDGIIAKRFRMETVLGGFLDPIADKALLVGTYMALGNVGYLPVWLVILVVFRDALIIGGAILFHTITHSLTMQPMLISKVNTVIQLILLVVVVGGAALNIDLSGYVPWLTYLVAITTTVSGLTYIVRWTKRAGDLELVASTKDDGK
ncbi:MAG: hypothetical protein CBB68_07740 [Rhodospirillaceae bacterium TMED8]|nr:CDP-alcohol phosphatidyltransferase [Magnetovibrio sp.]OUT50871.1 MAG: hypothetical protein CBB68_07740 [Rhodospirillaceae bacterium TMED8]